MHHLLFSIPDNGNPGRRLPPPKVEVTAPSSAGSADGGAEVKAYGFSLKHINISHAGLWKCQVDDIMVNITVSSFNK